MSFKNQSLEHESTKYEKCVKLSKSPYSLELLPQNSIADIFQQMQFELQFPLQFM